jgi:hypothetical protein
LIVGEDFVTDWNWSFDDFIVDLFVVEVKVEHVEVVTTVDGPHNGHSSDEVMGEFVPMPLNDCIDCSYRYAVE